MFIDDEMSGTRTSAPPDAAEAIARRVVELLDPSAVGKRYLDTPAVARMLGVSEEWVRDHAGELGAEIDARRVDDFRQKLHARGLSARSVNMALDLLAQILDDAVEYGLLDANPARGRRRRMKVAKSRRTFLEPDQVIDLLGVAGAWERELPPHQQYGRRALLAALCLAGSRPTRCAAPSRASPWPPVAIPAG